MTVPAIINCSLRVVRTALPYSLRTTVTAVGEPIATESGSTCSDSGVVAFVRSL